MHDDIIYDVCENVMMDLSGRSSFVVQSLTKRELFSTFIAASDRIRGICVFHAHLVTRVSIREGERLAFDRIP